MTLITGRGARVGAENVTAPILSAMKRDRRAEIPLGLWRTQGPLVVKLPDLARFAITGEVPVPAWAMHYHNGTDPDWSTIVADGLAADEPWLTLVVPKGVTPGNITIANLAVRRTTPGPFIHVRLEDDDSRGSLPSIRGLRLDSCQFVGPSNDHFLGARRAGGVLPLGRYGTGLYFENVYSLQVHDCGMFGCETQLELSDCDLAEIAGWHGGQCGRSIVVNGYTRASLSRLHIEAVGISGVDVEHAIVCDANVEAGYGDELGPLRLPSEVRWKTEAGGSRIRLTGPWRDRIAPQSVIYLDRTRPLYVVAVDDEGALIANPESGCYLEDAAGDGSRLEAVLGIPFVLRGEETAINLWGANLNMGQPRLPVMALFPHASAITVGLDITQQDKTWEGANRAVIGHWAKREQMRQFWRGGHVWWTGSEKFRPEHSRCFGPVGPRIDPNSGLEGVR